MPRNRFASIWPPGAIRLVPTLTTTLMASLQPSSFDDSHRSVGMVSHSPAEEDFFLVRLHLRANALGLAAQESRRGRTISLSAIKMAFRQDEELATFNSYAPLQRHQPLFQSRRELCALSAGISVRGDRGPENRMWPGAGSQDCRHRLRHGDLDSYAAGERQHGFRRRAQCGDA